MTRGEWRSEWVGGPVGSARGRPSETPRFPNIFFLSGAEPILLCEALFHSPPHDLPVIVSSTYRRVYFERSRRLHWRVGTCYSAQIMVLDGIASSLLNRLLGDFVTGFESANVKFSLSGELKLHNLQLKSNALDKLGLPIRVRASTLSTLQLRVPWRNLGSQPALVNIEGLYILAAPASRSRDDVRSPPQRLLCRPLRRPLLPPSAPA